jgi:hypothetical protein
MPLSEFLKKRGGRHKGWGPIIDIRDRDPAEPDEDDDWQGVTSVFDPKLDGSKSDEDDDNDIYGA